MRQLLRDAEKSSNATGGYAAALDEGRLHWHFDDAQLRRPVPPVILATYVLGDEIPPKRVAGSNPVSRSECCCM
jgi:hypothetical protein